MGCWGGAAARRCGTSKHARRIPLVHHAAVLVRLPLSTQLHAPSAVARGFAGPLRRRVIFDTLPKYTALKRDAIQGGQPLVQYCNTVERLLDAAANAPYVDVSVPEAGLHRHQNTRADDDGEGAVLAAERVVWQLLHVFFVSQGRVIGSIAQDLAYWLFTNAGLLCGGFTAEDAVRQVLCERAC